MYLDGQSWAEEQSQAAQNTWESSKPADYTPYNNHNPYTTISGSHTRHAEEAKQAAGSPHENKENRGEIRIQLQDS